MARIRTIKPEFWTDDTITECSLSARLLFIGLWNFADDSGNLDRSPKQIKARVFPVDNIDCEPLIQELIAHALLTEYSVSEQKFLHIRGFTKHQVINRPSKPVVPAYAKSLSPPAPLTEPSVTTHAGREGKGKEGKAEPRLARGSRIPEDFRPDLDEAVKQIPDLDAEGEAKRFCDYWKAKTGAGATKADWPATWRNWIRNCADSGRYAKRKPAVHADRPHDSVRWS